MGAASDLFSLLKEYLGACEAAVATAPGGAIDRAFVSPGPPAWDCCPQLTVHAGGPAVGDTAPLSPPLQSGHRVAGTGLVDLVTMTATVLRCVPGVTAEGGGQLPDPAAVEAAAQETSGDVWAIWNYLVTHKKANTLFHAANGVAQTREMWLDPAVALNQQGGCAGWQIQVRVQLDGYRTA